MVGDMNPYSTVVVVGICELQTSARRASSRHAQNYCEDVEEKLREAHTFLIESSGRDVGSASRHAQKYCEDVEEKLREAHTFLQQHFGGDKGAYLRLLRRVFGGTQKMRSRRCRRSGARHGAFEHYHPPSHPPSFPTALSVGADDCANNAQCLNGRLRSPTRARTTQRPRRRIPFFSVQRCRSPWATAPPSRSTSVC